MNKKETEVILQRIQNWYGRLPNLFIMMKKNSRQNLAGQKNLQNLRIDYRWTINRLMKRNPGGKKWESAWFHLEGRVPEGVGWSDCCG